MEKISYESVDDKSLSQKSTESKTRSLIGYQGVNINESFHKYCKRKEFLLINRDSMVCLEISHY